MLWTELIILGLSRKRLFLSPSVLDLWLAVFAYMYIHTYTQKNILNLAQMCVTIVRYGTSLSL